jgi:hypothetical protein
MQFCIYTSSWYTSSGKQLKRYLSLRGSNSCSTSCNWIPVCVFVFMSIYMCVCVCVCVFVFIYMCVCLCLCLYTCVYVCLCVCLCLCLYMCLCVCLCVYVFMSIYMCACIKREGIDKIEYLLSIYLSLRILYLDTLSHCTLRYQVPSFSPLSAKQLINYRIFSNLIHTLFTVSEG